MKRFDPILLKVFLYGIPLVAALGVFSYLYSVGIFTHDGGHVEFLNSLAGIIIAAWMSLSIYLSIRLIVSGPFRDQVLARITFIRERDEREAILTGKAARTALLTTLAFLILLFCLSCFQVSIYKVPAEEAHDGKTGFVSLGLGFSLLEQGKHDFPEDRIKEKVIFHYRGLPLSSAAVILVLIGWQIISYNYSMRRLLK